MERVVVTHMRDDICLVSHQEQTLSAHTTEQEALSAAFAIAARCTQKGDKTVVVLTREQGHRPASQRRRDGAGCSFDDSW
jgi:hypothetical protein